MCSNPIRNEPNRAVSSAPSRQELTRFPLWFFFMPPPVLRCCFSSFFFFSFSHFGRNSVVVQAAAPQRGRGSARVELRGLDSGSQFGSGSVGACSSPSLCSLCSVLLSPGSAALWPGRSRSDSRCPVTPPPPPAPLPPPRGLPAGPCRLLGSLAAPPVGQPQSHV